MWHYCTENERGDEFLFRAVDISCTIKSIYSSAADLALK